MKRFFTLLMMWTVVATIYAIPAHPRLLKHTQKDGTTLFLRLQGDEYMHYYLNTQNGTKMLKGEDGDYYLMPDSLIQEVSLKARARRSMENERRKSRLAGLAKVGGISQGMKGKKKGIVILVNFTDKKFASGHVQTTFDQMFNLQGYHTDGHIGSVKDYFKDQSYGQFELDFDVVGPVTVSHTMSYYGGNDSNDNDLRPGHMVKEACQLANSQVNFADYDWDGDEEVDQVFVIYAGYGENYGADENTIWPHEWNLYSATGSDLTLDGVKIHTYACTAELSGTSGTTLNGIGTACHEFSHCLGYPDYYDTDYSGGQGMNSYDVMDSGSYNGPNGNGEVPCGFSAYERWVAGWLTPEELTEPCCIKGMADLGDEPQAFVIFNSAHKDEFFLLENRQDTRWFAYVDKVNAGHGLFITHIDYNESVWAQNAPNDTKSRQRVTWVPADKNYGTYNSSDAYWTVSETQGKGDFFPGSKSVTSFTPSDWSTTGGKWYNSENGTYYSPHFLSDIKETNGSIAFNFDGGDDGTRYTVTYHPGAGQCTTPSWTQQKKGESATLPSCTLESDLWTFAGWCTSLVEETQTQPSIMKAGSTYKPEDDCTLYAVYVRTEGTGEEVYGQYVLDYNEETALSTSIKWGSYGTAYNYTASDGGLWVIKAYKYQGIQLNNAKDASIKVPNCPGDITTIEIVENTTYAAKALYFSTTDYTGKNSPTVVVQSETSRTPVIDLTGKGLKTGYIYTTGKGATSITRIVVNYGIEPPHTWATHPAQEGDINKDGIISLDDLCQLIALLNNPSAHIPSEADINHDTLYDLIDVTQLEQIILKALNKTGKVCAKPNDKVSAEQ